MKGLEYVILCVIFSRIVQATSVSVNSTTNGETTTIATTTAKVPMMNTTACTLDVTGRHPCYTTNCQHATKVFPTGCCTCICRKNYAKVGDEGCAKAKWTKWSSYGKCFKTDWGGIQTKERICKSGNVEAPGACVGRGSMARTCSQVKREFRIRKNLKDLTDEEIHDLIQGMTKFKEDESNKGFRYIVSMYGWPGICKWYQNISGHENGQCGFHHHPLFRPFHRLFIVELELGLSRHLKNKTLGIPFWDFTEVELDLPYMFRESMIFDPILKIFVPNPFHETFIKYVNGTAIYTQREPNYNGLLMGRYHLKGSVRGLLCHSYWSFDSQISFQPHDELDNCMCSRLYSKHAQELCKYGLRSTNYAAYDPSFLFHHSALDRVSVMKRHLEDHAGASDWTKSRVMGQYLGNVVNRSPDYTDAFDWPMSPFCNKSINPFPETRKHGIWTFRHQYYDKEMFGYKYDNHDFENYPWDDLVDDYKRNNVDRKYWNDEYFDSKLGPLTIMNSLDFKRVDQCSDVYSNPVWDVQIIESM